MKKLFTSVLFAAAVFCLLPALSACSSGKTVTAGSFTFQCPADLEPEILEAEKADVYRDVQSVHYVDGKEEYERTFWYEYTDHLILHMDMIWADPIEGMSLSDLNESRRAYFLKTDTWTLLEQIEKTEERTILRAAPYKEDDVRDNGVYYVCYFQKEDGIGYVDLIVREDADAKYRDAIEMILKTVH